MLIKNDDGLLNGKKLGFKQKFSYHLYLRDTIKHAIENNDIPTPYILLLRNL